MFGESAINMVECEHKWKYSKKLKNPNISLDRECIECGIKEHRHYLGGSMWRWGDDDK